MTQLHQASKHATTEARLSTYACKQPVRAWKRIGRNILANNYRSKQRRKQSGHCGNTNTRMQAWLKRAVLIYIVLGMVATVLTVCWDPHTANRIGEAAKPGPVCIVSRNIHGIYSNLMQCIRTKADIICIQEADITESDVLDFTGQALTAGYTCKWGQPLQIAKTSGGKNGRRVAMLIKKTRRNIEKRKYGCNG